MSLGIFLVENHPKIALNQYWYFGVLFVYTLLKIVCYYDLSVLSMSVIKKSLDGGWVGGWGELYPSLFFIFLTLQSSLPVSGCCCLGGSSIHHPLFVSRHLPPSILHILPRWIFYTSTAVCLQTLAPVHPPHPPMMDLLYIIRCLSPDTCPRPSSTSSHDGSSIHQPLFVSRHLPPSILHILP